MRAVDSDSPAGIAAATHAGQARESAVGWKRAWGRPSSAAFHCRPATARPVQPHAGPQMPSLFVFAGPVHHDGVPHDPKVRAQRRPRRRRRRRRPPRNSLHTTSFHLRATPKCIYSTRTHTHLHNPGSYTMASSRTSWVEDMRCGRTAARSRAALAPCMGTVGTLTQTHTVLLGPLACLLDNRCPHLCLSMLIRSQCVSLKAAHCSRETAACVVFDCGRPPVARKQGLRHGLGLRSTRADAHNLATMAQATALSLLAIVHITAARHSPLPCLECSLISTAPPVHQARQLQPRRWILTFTPVKLPGLACHQLNGG